MNDNPKISVIMPVYNGERFLRKAVDSILNQTFKDFEFIIINDGSTDGTREILESYRDHKIVLAHQENMGHTMSLNRAIAMARGKYIARQDADDISVPERLETQFEYMERNPRIGLVGSYYLIVDEDGNPINGLAQDNLPTRHKDLVKFHFKTFYIGHGTFFFRKTIVDSVGMYDEDLNYCEDMDFVFRVAERFEISNIPQVLYKWTMVSGSKSTKNAELRKQYRYLAINKALLRKAEKVSETVLHWGILEKLLSGYYRLIANYIYRKYRLDELKEKNHTLWA